MDTLTDQHIQTAVEAELRWTPDVESAHIGVSVENHSVTLTGTVGSFAERTASRRAAFRVQGVSAVTDELAVHYVGAPLTNTDLAESIAHVLDHNAAVPPGTVKASAHDHRLALTSVVPWNYQRNDVARIVGSVRGDIHVDRHISLNQPSASVLATTIKASMARNAALDEQQINIQIDGDEVTLTGKLSSWEEKKQAGFTAWSCPGVGAVHNNIQIEVS